MSKYFKPSNYLDFDNISLYLFFPLNCWIICTIFLNFKICSKNHVSFSVFYLPDFKNSNVLDHHIICHLAFCDIDFLSVIVWSICSVIWIGYKISIIFFSNFHDLLPSSFYRLCQTKAETFPFFDLQKKYHFCFQNPEANFR